MKVNTNITTISTDALRIDNGQLTMGPLNITSHGGSNFIIYDEDSFDELDENMDRIKSGMKKARENSKEASDSAKSIDNIKPPEDIKSSFDDLKRQMDGVKNGLKSIQIK